MRIRTGYSFKAAVGHIAQVMDRLVECKYTAAPITDRNSMFGFVRWAKLAKEKGLKPIFGVELGVTEDLTAKKPTIDYWTFLAIDDIYHLNKLFEMATAQAVGVAFLGKIPCLTYKQAQEAEGLVKITSHMSRLDQIDPETPNLYVPLAPSCSKGYLNEVIAKGFKLIASSDNVYTSDTDEHRHMYEIIIGKSGSIQSYDQFIQTDVQWGLSVKDKVVISIIDGALNEREWVIDLCIAELKQGVLLTPDKPKTLLKMCEEGAELIGIDLSDPVYKARMDRELGLIAQKNFEDYFYIIADMVQHARKIMIVGPGRGSSCGSLVCDLLQITTIDPIPYGLIFERFIDANRDDLPDIDIDFADQQRHLVFEYMADKYGSDLIARLGTVNLYKQNSCIQEAGKALRVPRWKCDALKESMIKRKDGDARALNTIEDTFRTMPAGQEFIAQYPEMKISAKMEGHPSHYGQHAAGIILTQEPVNRYVATDIRTGATQCDKKDAEALNLLKIDALGLIQLSACEDTLEMAGLDRLTLESIPMDDPAAFKVLNDKKYAGIFQFNGQALQSIAKQFTITSEDDIICVTAVARPGPMGSGGAQEWVKRRNKTSPVVYPHPMFEPHMKDTLGIVLYQEQVMQIGRNIGDLSWKEVSALRKAMSKSLGKESFDKFGDKWKKKAIEKGGDPKVMEKFWDNLCAYGSWSFNKSHAVAYGRISYWCCWLKAHYPFEFAAATLTHEKVEAKQLKLLREIVEEGYNYIPIDAEQSTNKWTVGQRDGKRILIGPVSNVSGIGPKITQTIMSARARGEQLSPAILKKLTNPVTPIDSLWPIKDAFKRLLPNPEERKIMTKPTSIIDIEIRGQEYDVVVFCTFSKINPKDENASDKVAKRNGKRITEGPTASLNLNLTDDTDTVFGKINRWDYARIAKPIVDRGQPDKFLYVVKGTVISNKRWDGTENSFRMLVIKHVRYIGGIKDKPKTTQTEMAIDEN